MYEDISFTEDEVYDAIGQLRSKMSDTTGIFTEHLKFSRSVIALPLSLFFTPIVRHGHMPQLIRHSTLVPIPKNNKVASVSANYRPIALSSMLSKVLERLLLNMLSSSVVVICSLASNLGVQQLFVLEWSRTLYRAIFIVVPLCLAVFWMPLERSI